MGAGNFGSPVQLLILLAIVLLFFGGNRLRNLGSDLGGAIKGFKKAMDTVDTDPTQESARVAQQSFQVLDADAKKVTPEKSV